MKRCVSWIAVSSRRQAKGASLDAQAESNRKFIEESLPNLYGVDGTTVATLQVADTRSIIEFSAACEAYPDAYGALRRMIADHSFDILACHRDDRLGREPALIMTIRSLCRAAGILVVESSQALPRSLDAGESEVGNYTSAFSAARSRNEILTMRDRRATGMARRMDEARLFPGRVPFGYTYTYTKDGTPSVAIDKPAAATVRFILVDLYLHQGLGAQSIRDELNAAGRAAPEADSWTAGSVQEIIARAERYGAIIEYGTGSDQYIQRRGAFEAILTDDEYERVVKMRNAKSLTKERQPLVLSGIALCADCGHRINYQVKTSRRKDKVVRILMCRNRECSVAFASADEALVLDAIRTVITGLAAVDDLAGYVQETTRTSALDDELGRLQATQKRLQRARLSIIRSHNVLEIISENEMLVEMQAVEREADAVEAAIAALEQRMREATVQAQILDRLEEAKMYGVAMLDRIGDEPALVNSWLRSRLQVHVRLYKRDDDWNRLPASVERVVFV